MANAGAIRPLDQRKIKAALGISNNAGRPEQMQDGKRRNVYMSESDAEYLRSVGDGNISSGIRRLINDHKPS